MTFSSALAGIASGALGAMGMGGGGVLLIYLTLFLDTEPLKARGINLLFFIPCGLIAVAVYAFKKQLDIRKTALMWLGGVPGALLGFFLAERIDTSLLSDIFALFLIVFGAVQLFRKNPSS